MVELMFMMSLVLIICMMSTKALYRFGVPMLLIFMVLGMIFGSDGLVGMYFDNFDLAGQLCSIGLVFIMFYGGFGTNWELAKPVVVPAALMSSLGVLATAALTGVFCNVVLGMTLLEGLLVGTVVASTDSASVFAVLRAQKLNLKGSLASFLELESGSNDPMAYMLTLVIISLMKGASSITAGEVIVNIITQILIGLSIGVILAKVTVRLLRHSDFEIEGFYTIFTVAIAVLVYALSEILGGNGYLGVYVAGIIIGNSKIPQKRITFHFFDGISYIMQIILFFLLGLLSFPSQLSEISVTAILISAFMIFVARPLATFVVLAPFKFTLKEKMFISWVGLRGAASLVFAIFAITSGVNLSIDIFHIIFFIALFSVAIQGSLIPRVAKRLDLIDDSEGSTVLKTFTDYKEEVNAELLEYTLVKNDPLIGKTLVDMDIPNDILIVMIKRKGKIVVPRGFTVVEEGDTIVFTGSNIQKYIAEYKKNK